MISLEAYPFYIYIHMTVKYLHQYNQYSYPNIEANIFESRFLKRAAKMGSSFLAIYLF